jgi:hypothetical protein
MLYLISGKIYEGAKHIPSTFSAFAQRNVISNQLLADK